MTYTKKSKHSAPAPECIDKSKEYSITLNPSTVYKDVKTLRTWWHRKLLEVSMTSDQQRTFTYDLKIEVSCMGKLHMHGVIRIHKVMLFYIYTLQKLQDVATYEIDTKDDTDYWPAYCTKQSDLHKEEGYNNMSLSNNMYTANPDQQVTPLKDHSYKEYLDLKVSKKAENHTKKSDRSSRSSSKRKDLLIPKE